MIKMYKVNGAAGHRQRESFYPSYKFEDFEKIKTTVLNADITETNNYSIVIFEADTKEKIEKALDGQLYDGIFENSNFGEVIEITEKEEFNQYVNQYIPDMKLIFDAKYLKKWHDNTIQRGKIEEISRNEAHDLIWEYYSNNGCDDEEIEKEIKDFDEYHVIDLGDYTITIEGIDE
jgi:hypothetical protein